MHCTRVILAVPRVNTAGVPVNCDTVPDGHRRHRGRRPIPAAQPTPHLLITRFFTASRSKGSRESEARRKLVAEIPGPDEQAFFPAFAPIKDAERKSVNVDCQVPMIAAIAAFCFNVDGGLRLDDNSLKLQRPIDCRLISPHGSRQKSYESRRSAVARTPVRFNKPRSPTRPIRFRHRSNNSARPPAYRCCSPAPAPVPSLPVPAFVAMSKLLSRQADQAERRTPPPTTTSPTLHPTAPKRCRADGQQQPESLDRNQTTELVTRARRTDRRTSSTERHRPNLINIPRRHLAVVQLTEHLTKRIRPALTRVKHVNPRQQYSQEPTATDCTSPTLKFTPVPFIKMYAISSNARGSSIATNEQLNAAK